jgi:hypothetical protein
MVAKKPTALVTEQPKTPLTVLEKIRKLNADRLKLEETHKGLRETAKAELLAQGQEVVASLKELGYTYVLTEPKKKAHPKQSDGAVRERVTPEGKVCPICGFGTRPVHDARTHRHMKEKKPFTEAELQEKNLVRL